MEEEPELPSAEEDPDMARLQSELSRLRVKLEVKETALAETRQKMLRQRVLYEKAHKREQELKRKTEDQELEHAELIALREFVYGLQKEEQEEEDLDEQTKEQIIEAIKDRKVAILGGTERWIKRMKKLLPSWCM